MERDSKADNQPRIVELDREKSSQQSILQLLHSLKYDFLSPLATLRNAYDCLQASQLSSEQQQCMAILDHASLQLVQRLNDVIDLLKLESGILNVEKSPVDLQDCLMKVSRPFQAQMEKKEIDLTVIVEKELPSIVLGDQRMLERLLHHLIENAVKYTQAGQVNISATLPRQLAEEEKVVFVEFTVSDTGIGIPKDHVRKMQQFFKQAKPIVIPVGSCQLGLALCKYVSDLLKGTIQVESEVKRGTIFHVVIPFEVASQQLL